MFVLSIATFTFTFNDSDHDSQPSIYPKVKVPMKSCKETIINYDVHQKLGFDTVFGFLQLDSKWYTNKVSNLT